MLGYELTLALLFPPGGFTPVPVPLPFAPPTLLTVLTPPLQLTSLTLVAVVDTLLVLELLYLVNALVDPPGLDIDAAAEVEDEVPEFENMEVEVEVEVIEFRQLVDEEEEENGRAVEVEG